MSAALSVGPCSARLPCIPQRSGSRFEDGKAEASRPQSPATASAERSFKESSAAGSSEAEGAAEERRLIEENADDTDGTEGGKVEEEEGNELLRRRGGRGIVVGDDSEDESAPPFGRNHPASRSIAVVQVGLGSIQADRFVLYFVPPFSCI